MTDYDDLVRRLRAGRVPAGKYWIYLAEAADAIEALRADRDEARGELQQIKDAYMRSSDHGK